MNILRSAAVIARGLIVAAAIYSGATQPLYVIVPKSQEQIEQCLAQTSVCASSCSSPSPCGEKPGCATVPCDEESSAPCPYGDNRPPVQARCCSLISTQPGVEGSRLSVDDNASKSLALLPVTADSGIPDDVYLVDDQTFIPPGSPPISPPPSRAPPLG